MRTARRRLFGTDGIRGKFGPPPLDRATLSRVATALVEWLADQGRGEPTVVLGGDTRESTPQIAAWLEAALEPMGANVIQAGVVPTPGVAFLIQELEGDAGIVVSASHNPYPDNGVKILDHRGRKLDDNIEAEIERRAGEAGGAPPGGTIEPALPDPQQTRRFLELYLDSLTGSLEGEAPLADLSVVLDTGHGAASGLAGEAFRRLGAECLVLNNEPNGRNVNQRCGSTAPELAASAVVDSGFDLGFAFDGDADRAIFCDHQGVVHDGDEILYLWARDLAQKKGLRPPSIVATSMSNLGLEHALRPLGIGVVRCDVGDRQVVRTLIESGLRLGGEQSGHIIDLERSTTGDGLLTALQIADIVCREAVPAGELLAGFERFPQILHNVPVSAKPPLGQLPRTAALATAIEEELGAEGRLVLRYSGTESLARIMLEGPDLGRLEDLARELAGVLDEETKSTLMIGTTGEVVV